MPPIVVTPTAPGEGAALVDALANAKTLAEVRAAAETVRGKRPQRRPSAQADAARAV